MLARWQRYCAAKSHRLVNDIRGGAARSDRAADAGGVPETQGRLPRQAGVVGIYLSRQAAALSGLPHA